MSSSRATVLVIEDEASIAETIVYALQTEGFSPLWKTTGQEGLAALRADKTIALVVLDVGLPDMSGFDVCREVQKLGAFPVIFLTARAESIDKIVGLELGADDYLAKPFSPRELTARVRAVLRRTHGAKPEMPVSAPPGFAANGTSAAPAALWLHDEARCRISYRGRALDLTRNEYRLLIALLAQPGRVFNREQLMNAAWENPEAAFDRTVDAHIKTLRAKLREAGPDADPIVTHRGLGYSLREES